MIKQYSRKSIIRMLLLLLLCSSVYYLFHRKGYLPPINYLSKKSTQATDLQLPLSQVNLLNYNYPITELLTSPIDKSQIAILVEKSQFRLTIYYQNQPIKSYPVVFGANPSGDKLQEGDMKTPEGIFKVRDLYPHDSWSKFIWLDYPNHDSWSKHLQAKKLGKIAWSASIGSEIGIHGVNHNTDYLIDEGNNWTWGCISLKNKDVDEIYSVVTVGTIVKISP
ncbi:MAG: L,D-transpeptidase [Xenococcaceae cyanobacterium MO_207.B15]|nr:L,D-transpeptidase [Xenococcaceae cyanobacterium MO_207.B15]